MALGDIIGSYKLSPDAEERFSQSFIRNIRGTVRTNLGSLLSPVVLFSVLGLLELWLFRTYGGLIGMLTLILYLVGTFIFFWEMLSFRLEFDGSTGFIQYHTLLRGTTAYHIDELMMFDVQQQRLSYQSSRFRHGRFGSMPAIFDFSDFYRARRTLRVRELLTITTATGIIVIPLSSSWFSSRLVHGVGGFHDAEKFYTYLDLYRRYALKNSPLSDAPAEDDALSPAVRAAIAQQMQETEQALPESIPELTAEDINPTAIPKEKVSGNLLSTPDISVPVTGIPETHSLPQKIGEQPTPAAAAPAETAQAEPAPVGTTREAAAGQSAFPDPAQKPADISGKQTPPDVDALFNNVLRQFGKR